eukprot:gnl/MRDRNA2_/MRDRNA2_32943_c0_seq1.p1 gnl/MRDRNA2_/MRDRNA2_32943_c0~~gnl/MRDRNA2_/MRDRNA2_32943_c0_seq1.p1  ORF type:complete len:230 (+),score=58.80 gnl/MRDRNA2_/MRDRNA2_32943_c0_seq1:59-748(+)
MDDDYGLDGNWAPEPVSEQKKGEQKKGKKRKAELQESKAPASKKLKQNKKERTKKAQSKEEIAAAGAAFLAESWHAHAYHKKLSPLEQKEIDCDAAWMAPLPLQTPLSNLPEALKGLPSCLDLHAKISDGALLIVLCISADRGFTVSEEIKKAWKGIVPVALYKHGGGRNSDQLSRQAKAFSKGCAVAVGTPGRLARLLDEGSISLNKTSLIVLDLHKDVKNFNLTHKS